MRRILVIGSGGSGKTRLSGELGARLGLPVVHLDALFLDMPRYICISRVLMRWLRYAGRTRPHMAPGCPERVTWEFLRWIWDYPKRRRPEILRRLAQLPPDRNVHVLRTRADVDRLLSVSGRLGR